LGAVTSLTYSLAQSVVDGHSVSPSFEKIVLLLVSFVYVPFLAVLALMGKNPFPNKPPKYIRANLYHYHYTQKDPSHQW